MRIYRASSLGYSLEQLVAPHLGYEPVSPPDFLQAAFDEGHRIEPLAIEKLREKGWFVQDNQLEVELPISDNAKVVGHLDGTGHPQDLPWGVIEIKSMAEKSWTQFARQRWDSPGIVQKYKWQASAYMLATNKPHYMVAWNKASEELAVEYTREPFYTLDQITAKVLEAEKYIAKGELPEGCNDFPCSFFYLHPNKDAIPVTSADETLDQLLDEWLILDRREKVAKALKDKCREEILALSGDDLSAGKVKGTSGVTVSTTWVESKHVEYDVKPHWETRIQGPKNAAK